MSADIMYVSYAALNEQISEMVGGLSAFGLSNNDKWRWLILILVAFRQKA